MAGAIVCGVDDSVEASEALLVARWLGERLAAPLVLVHTAGVAADAAGAERSRYAELREEALDGARRLLERIRDEHGLGAAELRPVLGDPAETLCTVAEDVDARAIVVGSHGHGRLRAALLGSVSCALTTRAPCPVVAVPLGAAVPRFVRPAAA